MRVGLAPDCVIFGADPLILLPHWPCHWHPVPDAGGEEGGEGEEARGPETQAVLQGRGIMRVRLWPS